MKIIDGRPVFGINDTIYSHDDKYAYDAQRNVMGAFDPNQIGEALNTDQTSFMDLLAQGNGLGLAGGVTETRNGDYIQRQLSGVNADMWGQNNPYAQFLLNRLTGGQNSLYSPIVQAPVQAPAQSSASKISVDGYAPSTQGNFDLMQWLSDVFSSNQNGAQSTAMAKPSMPPKISV